MPDWNTAYKNTVPMAKQKSNVPPVSADPEATAAASISQSGPHGRRGVTQPRFRLSRSRVIQADT